MMNYLDKRFEEIEKKLQQPLNKNAKIENTLNLNINRTECNLNSTNKFYK